MVIGWAAPHADLRCAAGRRKGAGVLRKAAALLVGFVGAALLSPAAGARSGDDPAAPAIVNGLLTSDFPTTGVLLSGGDPDGAIAWCSGTLVGCGTFLTAAHCVCATNGALCQGGAGAPDPADWLVFLQHAGFFAVESVAVHADYAFPVADVAVLRLAAPVAGVAPTPLPEAATPFGTPGTIVGFGRSGGSNDDYGLKRFGDVVTAACTAPISDATSLCWDFAAPVGAPGSDSNTCNADSGGPLFVDLGGGDVVAGVTSGGSSSSCLALDHSYDANVFPYAAWIRERAGADLGQARCGGLAQVGEPGARVRGFTGSLGGPTPEGRHTIEVPAGATLLRVGMNASEAGNNDFDLYVKAGSPPTTSSFDCAANGANQWGFCAFAAPAAGTWHVLVRRFKGSGVWQTTATLFLPQCANGVDDDGDGGIDWDGDPQGLGQGPAPPDGTCAGRASFHREGRATCGLGVELGALLPALAALRRQLRRRSGEAAARAQGAAGSRRTGVEGPSLRRETRMRSARP